MKAAISMSKGGMDCLFNYSNLNSKFPADKANYDDEFITVMLDGVILNLKQLQKEHDFCGGGTHTFLITLWKQYGANMITLLKGKFCLFVYDKVQKKCLVANDRLSKRPLYYFKDDCRLFVCDSLYALLEELKDGRVKLSYNPYAFYFMIKQGYLPDKITYYKEIKYLGYNEYFEIDGKIGEPKAFENETIELSDKAAALKKFDALFSDAVNLQFAKNRDNGYMQFSSISGGMDSRSCLLKADKLGYKEITCFSYSQSNSMDFQISQRLTGDYDWEFFNYNLDNAAFVLKPDAPALKNECQQCYCGSTGAVEVSELLNLAAAGIIHTGSLGGELMSDCIENLDDALPSADSLNASEEIKREYAAILSQYKFNSEYKINEYMRCCQNFFRMFDSKAECISPFMDEDVFEFVMALPKKWKFKRVFYMEWMKKYIPNKYITTYFKTNIYAGGIRRFFTKVKHRLIKIIKGKNRFDMNPFECWFSVRRFKSKFDLLVKEKLEKCDMPKSVSDIIEQGLKGGAYGRVYALTCIQAVINSNKFYGSIE